MGLPNELEMEESERRAHASREAETSDQGTAKGSAKPAQRKIADLVDAEPEAVEPGVAGSVETKPKRAQPTPAELPKAEPQRVRPRRATP